jgi:metallo-beta-lactamase class B
MKNCFLIFLVAFYGHAQKLEIKKLTDDFYIFTTYKEIQGKPFPSNGMYVVTEKGVLIIDSPWDATQCQPLLDSISQKHGKKVIHAIATHFHDDRTGAFNFFKEKGIKTWSTYRTYDLCVKNGEQQAALKFTDETSLDFGSHTLRAFWPGEGHTQDNIVIWFEKEKILYGGCLVKSTENQTLGNIADANLTAWPETIRNLMRQCPDAKYVIPGHFGWQGNPLQHTLDLLEEK